MNRSPRNPDPSKKGVSRRALAKGETRRRLLEATRALIMNQGLESATVRGVSAAAKVSTGALFSSFADKDELIHEVILGEGEALEARLAAADVTGRSARAALIVLVRAAFGFHLEALPMARAIVAYTWLKGPISDRCNRPGSRMILAHFDQALRQGVETGELSPTLDTALIAEMIWDSYVSDLRRAIFDGWDLAALEARITAQIDVLLDGFQIAA